MRDKNTCACGRGKYPDADCCEVCWNRQAGYDERRGNDSSRCSCGAGKVADASMCDDCARRQSGYDDGRG